MYMRPFLLEISLSESWSTGYENKAPAAAAQRDCGTGDDSDAQLYIYETAGVFGGVSPVGVHRS